MANVLNANELKNGVVFVDSGETLKVLNYQHRKYGRGQATIRVKVRNLESGSISEKTYDSGAKFEEADISRSSAQFLYEDGNRAFFMNMDTYEQFSFSNEDLEGVLGFLREGEKVVILYLDGNPISVELPKTVELEVTESTPAVAGDTVNNANKQVTLETGLKVDVPMFIKQGDRIKVNTDSVTYVSRV